jgi:hypothetical protein
MVNKVVTLRKEVRKDGNKENEEEKRAITKTPQVFQLGVLWLSQMNQLKLLASHAVCSVQI